MKLRRQTRIQIETPAFVPPTRNKAEEMLFRHAVIIGNSSSSCGNCGTNWVSTDIRCTGCDTQLVFSVTQSISRMGDRWETIDETQEKLERYYPELVFAGRISSSGWEPTWKVVTEIPSDNKLIAMAAMVRAAPWG